MTATNFPPARQAAAQQEAIVTAALDLLAAGGPGALRVRDIAEQAGCTTMTVYSRFGGKEGIVEAIYLDGFERFTKAMNAEPPGRADERLLRLSHTYRSWAMANPGAYKVMFTEAVPGFTPSEHALLVSLGSFQVLVDAVEAAQIDGYVSADNALTAAWTLWGMTHGLVMLELAGMDPTNDGVDPDVVYDIAVRAILRGV